MPTDLKVTLADRPGSLLHVLDVLGDAGLTVEGCCGDARPGESWGSLHVLVEDADTAVAAFEAAGINVVSRHAVDVIEIEDRPGALAEALRGYADAGRNLEVIYMTGRARVVIGTEDMQEPRFGVRVKDARY